MADAYDILRFAIRGHSAVRTRLLRAAECLSKGDQPPVAIESLIEEFDLAHQRLIGALEVAAERGPAQLPLIPQPQPKFPPSP